MSHFSGDEIEVVIQSMGPTKAPRLDGLPLLFFQSGQAPIKEEVVEMTQTFFLFLTFIECVNDANLVLIPKKK